MPLDGSPLAERILGPARELGELWESQYRLLRVVAPPRSFLSSWNEGSPSGQRGLLDTLVSDAATYLEALAQQLRPSR